MSIIGEGLNNGEAQGTGAQLTEHVVELVASGRLNMQHPFTRHMTSLLADRIEGGVDPMGYVMATELLIADCMTGVNGWTKEPMPRTVMEEPPIVYGQFIMESREFARGAFGDKFADEVKQIDTQIAAAAQAKLTE